MLQLFVVPGGKVECQEAPAPELFETAVEIETRASGVSVGTETGFLYAWTDKTEGQRDVGYSAAGIIRGLGPKAEERTDLKVGQRVACYGGPHTRHAARLAVPWTLVAPIDDRVSFEEAGFCGIGAISMQGVRRGRFSPGERVVIYGMGILGQLCDQMLRAFGCYTLVLDRHPEHLALAKKCGCLNAYHTEKDDLEAKVKAFAPKGIDGAILTCNHEPPMTDQAASWCRERGRIVMMGGGSEIRVNRGPVFSKELDLLISRAGGPGRYNPIYEKGGEDMPPGFVRWTEGRNVAHFVEMVAQGQIDMKTLITHRFDLQEAAQAYELLMSKEKYSTMGVVFSYPES